MLRDPDECFTRVTSFGIGVRELLAKGRGILRRNHKGCSLGRKHPEHGPVLQGLAEGANDQISPSAPNLAKWKEISMHEELQEKFKQISEKFEQLRGHL